jgi:hypothetical protein
MICDENKLLKMRSRKLMKLAQQGKERAKQQEQSKPQKEDL